MIEQLKNIDAELTALIKNDPFADAIEPDYLRKAVISYPLRGGKRLRPALAMWSCGLNGGNPADVLPLALSVELFHNWTLIHDDVIDNDAVRRGQPSIHVQVTEEAKKRFSIPAAEASTFGINTAILAGDILHGWAVHTLCRMNDKQMIAPLVAEMTGTLTPLLISGEMIDVEFELAPPSTAKKIEQMLRWKTGILLRYAAEGGTAAALQDPSLSQPEVKTMGHIAECAGLAFQLQDDILGMFGDEEQLGKPVGSDLREGKTTLLLKTALENASDHNKQILINLSGKKDLSRKEIKTACKIIKTSGAETIIRKRAESLLIDSRSQLERFPDNQYRSLLAQWLDYTISRTS